MRAFRRGPAGVRTGRGLLMAMGIGAGSTLMSTIEVQAKDQLQTIVLPEYYRFEKDSQVMLELSNGDQIRLWPDQYIILDDGLLLIVDELAQSSLSILPVLGASRTQLWTSSLPIMTTEGGVITNSDSQPVWPDSASRSDLFENLSIERYELAQNTDSSGSGADAGGNSGSGAGGSGGAAAGVGAGVGALGVAGIASGLASLKKATEKSIAATTVTPAVKLVGLGPVWPDASIPDEASFVLKASSENEFIGYDYPPTIATGVPLTVNQLVEDGLTFRPFSVERVFDMTAGGDKWLLISDQPDKDTNWKQSVFTYEDSPDDDTLEFGNKFGTGIEATFDMSFGGYNHLIFGSETFLDSKIWYIGGADTDTIGAGTDFGLGGEILIDNLAGGTNWFEAGTGSLSFSEFEYLGGTGNDTIQITPEGDSVVTVFMEGGTNQLDMNDGALKGGILNYIAGPGGDTLDVGDSFGASADIAFKAGGGTSVLSFGDGSLENGDFYFDRTYASSSNTLMMGSDFGKNATIEINNWFASGIGTFLLNAKDGFASSTSNFSFTGGANTNSLFFEDGFVSNRSKADIDMSWNQEGVIFQTHDGAAQSGGEIDYYGGSGPDLLIFGDDLALGDGTVQLRLRGNELDYTADSVRFLGSVGDPINPTASSGSTGQASVLVQYFGAGDAIQLGSVTDVNDVTITQAESNLYNVKNASETINFNVTLDQGALTVQGPVGASGVTIKNTFAAPTPSVTISITPSSSSSLRLTPDDPLI